MSNVANRRAFIEAARSLATSSNPNGDMILAACEAFAAVLTDLSGEVTHIIPLTDSDVRLLYTKEADHG